MRAFILWNQRNQRSFASHKVYSEKVDLLTDEVDLTLVMRPLDKLRTGIHVALVQEWLEKRDIAD